MSQPDVDLLLGGLPAKKSRIVATWESDCGSFPSPRLESCYVEDGLLVAPCNCCASRDCRVRRTIRTEMR